MLMFEVHAYDLLAVTSHQDDFGQYSYKKGKSSSQNLKYLLCIKYSISLFLNYWEIENHGCIYSVFILNRCNLVNAYE